MKNIRTDHASRLAKCANEIFAILKEKEDSKDWSLYHQIEDCFFGIEQILLEVLDFDQEAVNKFLQSEANND